MKRQYFRNQDGQTLVEIIIAIGMIIIALTTLVAGIAFGIANNRFARDEVLAKDNTRQATEWFRSIRDSMGWAGFYALITSHVPPVTYCLPVLPLTSDQLSTLPNSACSTQQTITGTLFYRSMSVTVPSANEIDATVTVMWTDGSKTHQTTSDVQLFSYQ